MNSTSPELAPEPLVPPTGTEGGEYQHHRLEEERLHEEHVREERVQHEAHEHEEQESHHEHEREEAELHQEHLHEECHEQNPGTYVIHFWVDEERLKTTELSLSVRGILKQADLAPETHYLVELCGHEQKPHNNLDEVLTLREDEKFISVFNGPTPVS